MSDLRARGDLAESLMPVAARLAGLVHGDGGPLEVRELLDGLDDAQRRALPVVIAGLVDPDQEIGKALGWLDFDEAGEVDLADWGNLAPIRSLAETGDGIEEPEIPAGYVDPVAVEAYASGRAVTVSKRERLEAIRLAVKRGLQYPDIDAMHGLVSSSTSTFISRSRLTFQDWGVPFPEIVQSNPFAAFSNRQVVEIREAAQAGATDYEIAVSYGVPRVTITNVVTGQTYRQCGGPIRPREDDDAAAEAVCAHRPEGRVLAAVADAPGLELERELAAAS